MDCCLFHLKRKKKKEPNLFIAASLVLGGQRRLSAASRAGKRLWGVTVSEHL